MANMENGEAGRVFISYRRQDTAWPARQLYELLVAELGPDRVFKDVDDIEPGDDFIEQIRTAVGSCQVLLALIGPQWLTIKNARGERRIDDPEDFVQLEIETALTRDDVRVIPILVDNAKMPTPQELPAGLTGLARRQAVEISPVNFDTRRLLKVLHETLNEVRQPPRTPPPPPTGPGPDDWRLPPADEPARDHAAARRRTVLVAVASSIVLLVAIGVAVWYFMINPGRLTANSPTSSTSGSSAPPAITTAPPDTPTPSPSETPTADSPTGSDILAHRGGNEEYPLQTFESITSAAEDGFAVETDVRWTSDGQAVIVHDENATRGVRCDQSYEVSKTTWEELKKHCRSFSKDQKDYSLATYAQVMEGLAGHQSWVYVEVKVDQNAAQNREFVDVIKDNGLSDRTVVTSNDLDRLAEIRELDPDLPRMLFVSEKVSASTLADEELFAVAVEKDVATKGYIRDLQDAGIVVVVWTVNEEQEWKEARSAGADKVLTDRPRAYDKWLGQQ